MVVNHWYANSAEHRAARFAQNPSEGLSAVWCTDDRSLPQAKGDVDSLPFAAAHATTEYASGMRPAFCLEKKAFKNETVLPLSIDDCIFNRCGAIYKPSMTSYQNNVISEDDEVKRYLGTYFPRSYGEMFCIINNMLSNKNIKKCIIKKRI